jgi:hypothetical protein
MTTNNDFHGASQITEMHCHLCCGHNLPDADDLSGLARNCSSPVVAAESCGEFFREHPSGYLLPLDFTKTRCNICDEDIDNGVRWVLTEEIMGTDWRSLDKPMIHITGETALGYFCSKEHALAAANAYLAYYGSNLMWSDYLPVERCGICGAPFETEDCHQTLRLIEVRGPENDPEVLQEFYLAHFCPRCVQVVF